jgi:hypothetical protein
LPQRNFACQYCQQVNKCLANLQVIPVINELGRTRLEVKVAVKSAFNDKLFALNVVIVIPMPDNTARADIHPSQGGFHIPVKGVQVAAEPQGSPFCSSEVARPCKTAHEW